MFTPIDASVRISSDSTAPDDPPPAHAAPGPRVRVASILLCLILPASWCAAGSVLFVDDDAPGGDGMTWPTAFRTLQEAIAAAGPGTEIRIAQGTYKPDQGPVQVPGNTAETFLLPDGVILRGGYVGFDQPDPELRDPDAFATILSGDLNDDGPLANFTDNSAHVLQALNLSVPVELDGFTVISGNGLNSSPTSTQPGGGLRILDSPVTITHCTFGFNRGRHGGGVSVEGASVVEINDCSFLFNTANLNGGGSFVGPGGGGPATVHYRRCSFISNTAVGRGGGLAFERANTGLVENCVIRDNISTFFSSALDFLLNEGTVVAGCQITDNVAESVNGGSVIGMSGSTPQFVNCTIANNDLDFDNAALQGDREASFHNCIVSNNSGLETPFTFIPAPFQFFHCIVKGGWKGAGEFNRDVNPGFVSLIGGNYRLSSSSIAIDAGIPSAPNLPANDLDGGLRIQHCRPDLGAYESSGFFDCNANGLEDGCETEADPTLDCNDNGVPDACDFASGFSTDVNANGIPDDCEIDCNFNDVPDAYEISEGLTFDCTLDGVPDECQFPFSYRYDDDEAELLLGGAPGDVLWLNRFIVEPEHEIVSSIIVAASAVSPNSGYSDTIVLLYSDPNGDGLPDDAQLLRGAVTFTLGIPAPIAFLAEIRPTFVGNPGDSFFVGAYINHNGSITPAPFDTNAPEMNSLLITGDSHSIDLRTTAGGTVTNFADSGMSGAWMLGVRSDTFDCDENGIDDRCDITNLTYEDLNANLVPDICERPGDLNIDTLVDVTDLLELLGDWGECRFCPADIDSDDQVNVVDLLMLLGNWS